MNPRTHQIIALILRTLIGTWFAYAGAIKIFVTGLHQFSSDIENYQLLPQNLTIITAHLIPWIEIIAGLCLILGILKKGATLAILSLILTFSLAIATAWYRGLDISCGCLGSTEKISYWKKIIEFTLYLTTLAYITWVESHKTPKTETLTP